MGKKQTNGIQFPLGIEAVKRAVNGEIKRRAFFRTAGGALLPLCCFFIRYAVRI